jgi:hypothetical protein
MRMDQIVRFLSLVRSNDEVAEETEKILVRYGRREAAMSKDKEKGSSETEEPWKLPGQSSQQPEQKSPPKRERDYKDNETA